jgi:hypothetical protein
LTVPDIDVGPIAAGHAISTTAVISVATVIPTPAVSARSLLLRR